MIITGIISSFQYGPFSIEYSVLPFENVKKLKFSNNSKNSICEFLGDMSFSQRLLKIYRNHFLYSCKLITILEGRSKMFVLILCGKGWNSTFTFVALSEFWKLSIQLSILMTPSNCIYLRTPCIILSRADFFSSGIKTMRCTYSFKDFHSKKGT